ncbi:PspC domain-containing protein [Candidatus Parcubacteria bacterium]|jgi:phage shock protein PspC (stress-responsive transcriptional regulator)|nr:MAG: PspC domain-containing protein [Candidatus Parcubacteria bacterium]
MTETKKLYRSKQNRIIGGVCAGLGEYFNIDPVIFRVLFVVLTILEGAGILIYIVLWIVIPEAGKVEAENQALGQRVSGVANEMKDSAQNLAKDFKENPNWLNNRRNFIGLAIVVLGLILLMNQFFPFHWFRWDIFWPIVIIFLGLLFIFKRR